MRHDRKNILVTRPLSGQQVEYARILGLEPLSEPALEFKFPEYWDEVLEVINRHPRAEWIFTSSNGVKALEQMVKTGLQVRPETRIFAVGQKTREALGRLGLDAIVPVQQDSAHLAEMIINEGKIKSTIYFHGNLSRDEMTHRLEEEGIEVYELEVYETIINPVYEPENPISGVLFYSPSAVEGYKRGQGFDSDNPPVYFAIGPTTEEALRRETDGTIVTAEEPDTRVLLQTASEHLFNGEKV